MTVNLPASETSLVNKHPNNSWKSDVTGNTEKFWCGIFVVLYTTSKFRAT